MASLTRNPRGQLRTPGVRTAPTGPRPRNHAGAAHPRAPGGPRGHKHARGGAAARSTGNQRGVRGPGNHTRHAPARGRRRNVTQQAQPRRRLLRCLHGLLQGRPPGSPSTGDATRPPGAATQADGRYAPHGATTSAPPARLHHPGADCRYGRRPKLLDPQACHRGAARTGGPHTMGTFFPVPPPRGGNTHHGRRHVWSSDTAHAPCHHGPPRPMALCGHQAHGAYGSLQPR